MPREGVFARVIRGGLITVGDQMRIQEPDPAK
jgi:MOSC domain-containing protein YiiM